MRWSPAIWLCVLIPLGCSDGTDADPTANDRQPISAARPDSQAPPPGTGPDPSPTARPGPALPGPQGDGPGDAPIGRPGNGPAPASDGTQSDGTQADAGRSFGDAGGDDGPAMVVCPSAPAAPGDHNGSVQVDGRNRTYVLHVPRNNAGDEPLPAVFDFHGYGSSGAGQMRTSGFRELSETHGFVGVYPDGVGGSWHVNGCCGQAAQAQLDEVAAVRAILSDVARQVCVDPARVYASGISQGGGMAHHVACLAADIFAAVAPVSSDLRTDPCEPARPISELSFRGTADNLSAYDGGPVGPPGMQYQSIGARPTFERWRMIDGCSGTPQMMLDVCETVSDCEAGVEVGLCSVPGAGHVLYDNPVNLQVAEVAWAMFERHSL